eukprot:TRINITY_DN6662_c0_g1_i1.p1 TRINITY_DN6662_c0_g1~~TRINITY_DN6662_c0_g1_i1.p1  ORF type:complete len:959 (+),score=176.08 TRINITY_DN6662_c0_g1_i1:428-2878(+)
MEISALVLNVELVQSVLLAATKFKRINVIHQILMMDKRLIGKFHPKTFTSLIDMYRVLNDFNSIMDVLKLMNEVHVYPHDTDYIQAFRCAKVTLPSQFMLDTLVEEITNRGMDLNRFIRDEILDYYLRCKELMVYSFWKKLAENKLEPGMVSLMTLLKFFMKKRNIEKVDLLIRTIKENRHLLKKEFYMTLIDWHISLNDWKSITNIIKEMKAQQQLTQSDMHVVVTKYNLQMGNLEKALELMGDMRTLSSRDLIFLSEKLILTLISKDTTWDAVAQVLDMVKESGGLEEFPFPRLVQELATICSTNNNPNLLEISKNLYQFISANIDTKKINLLNPFLRIFRIFKEKELMVEVLNQIMMKSDPTESTLAYSVPLLSEPQVEKKMDELDKIGDRPKYFIYNKRLLEYAIAHDDANFTKQLEEMKKEFQELTFSTLTIILKYYLKKRDSASLRHYLQFVEIEQIIYPSNLKFFLSIARTLKDKQLFYRIVEKIPISEHNKFNIYNDIVLFSISEETSITLIKIINHYLEEEETTFSEVVYNEILRRLKNEPWHNNVVERLQQTISGEFSHDYDIWDKKLQERFLKKYKTCVTLPFENYRAFLQYYGNSFNLKKLNELLFSFAHTFEVTPENEYDTLPMAVTGWMMVSEQYYSKFLNAISHWMGIGDVSKVVARLRTMSDQGYFINTTIFDDAVSLCAIQSRLDYLAIVFQLMINDKIIPTQLTFSKLIEGLKLKTIPNPSTLPNNPILMTTQQTNFPKEEVLCVDLFPSSNVNVIPLSEIEKRVFQSKISKHQKRVINSLLLQLPTQYTHNIINFFS